MLLSFQLFTLLYIILYNHYRYNNFPLIFIIYIFNIVLVLIIYISIILTLIYSILNLIVIMENIIFTV